MRKSHTTSETEKQINQRFVWASYQGGDCHFKKTDATLVVPENWRKTKMILHWEGISNLIGGRPELKDRRTSTVFPAGQTLTKLSAEAYNNTQQQESTIQAPYSLWKNPYGSKYACEEYILSLFPKLEV